MAEMRGASQNSNMENWARDAKRKARELRDSAHRAAGSLFRSGDLRDYLDLVCRLNHYDACNLLLILQQYPKATCLAGFKIWQKLLNDPSIQVLKPEWRGKGIDLIAPYTELYGNGRYSLTWFAVKQFDISQTNVKNFTATAGPYIRDEAHITRLLDCVLDVVASTYHRSVARIPASSQLRSAGLAGQMNDSTILVRDDIKLNHQLYFLCECLCQLAIEAPQNFSTLQTDLAIQYILYCLFRIWNVETPRPLHQNRSILNSFTVEQYIPLLSLIQRTVRLLDEDVAFVYRNSLIERLSTQSAAPPSGI